MTDWSWVCGPTFLADPVGLTGHGAVAAGDNVIETLVTRRLNGRDERRLDSRTTSPDRPTTASLLQGQYTGARLSVCQDPREVSVASLVSFLWCGGWTSTASKLHSIVGWRRGVVDGGVRRMDEVNARGARLVPGWVTVFGRVYRLSM